MYCQKIKQILKLLQENSAWLFIYNCLLIYLFIVTVCMEDLRGYELLRKQLMRGEFSLDIASSIAKNLAIVHLDTHISTIGSAALEILEKEFE